MPTKPVRRKGRIIGYRWGSKGKLYSTIKHGAKKAKIFASRQGRAIKASQAKRNYGSKIVKIKRKDGFVQRYHVGKKTKRRQKKISFMVDPDAKKPISKFEIAPKRRRPGKKARLIEAMEDIQMNLLVEDISDERRTHLLEKEDEVNEKLKRIQGSPPIKKVRGRSNIELQLGLIDRFSGTSGKRPEFVDAHLDIPGADPFIKAARIDRQRERSREAINVKKAIKVAGEKAERQATENNIFVFLGLEDVKRDIRGPKLGARKKKPKLKKSFGSFFGGNEDLIHGGLADNMSDIEFDKDQIRRGTVVEMEHTNDTRIAKEITKDHLVEHPKYYDFLDEAEEKMKKNKFVLSPE